MEYTLITKTGKVMRFYVEGVANLYCNLYGGVVFSQRILENSSDSLDNCLGFDIMAT